MNNFENVLFFLVKGWVFFLVSGVFFLSTEDLWSSFHFLEQLFYFSLFGFVGFWGLILLYLVFILFLVCAYFIHENKIDVKSKKEDDFLAG